MVLVYVFFCLVVKALGDIVTTNKSVFSLRGDGEPCESLQG